MASYKFTGSSPNFYFNRDGAVVGKTPEAQAVVENLSPALQACYDKACEVMEEYTTRPGEVVTWEAHIEPLTTLLSPLEVESLRLVLHL